MSTSATASAPLAGQKIHLVTGRLAEQSLREMAAHLAQTTGAEFTIDVLPITVAALMTPDWIVSRLRVPPETSRVILPGYCSGELEPVQQAAGAPVEIGPKDLRDLPEHLGGRGAAVDLSDYDIEILAEINFAARQSPEELLRQADSLAADGADVIDLGCEPGSAWAGVGEAVRRLRDAGHRVSIDSFDPAEIAAAARAGAELVLSVNGANRHAAADWGLEVVAIPDRPDDLDSLDATLESLAAAGVRFRMDPILEPIGFGFAASLARYAAARRRWPDAAMMMGIGNLTELTDVDSAGVNVLLLGFCQELGIGSVLTTQVIPWCQSAVRECDLARRLVRHAVRSRTLPKHVEPRLVMLRDEKTHRATLAEIDRLAAALRDPNYRLFVAEGQLHAVTAGQRLSAEDPFELWRLMQQAAPRPISDGHAFYLGYELCKALTALTLGKDYRQDEALHWGLLTREEPPGAHRRALRNDATRGDAAAGDAASGNAAALDAPAEGAP